MSMTQHYEGYGWMRIKRWIDDPELSWQDRFETLEHHHNVETTFLIAEIRKLATEIDRIKDMKKDDGPLPNPGTLRQTEFD